jgi:hypothetical protein
LAAMQKVALVEYFKILLSLTRLEKTWKINPDSQYPVLVPKSGPPEYEEGMTTAQPWHSVEHTLKYVKYPKVWDW